MATLHGMRILARVFSVLDDIAAAPGRSLDDIAGSTALPRATCARLLAALAELGWAAHRGRDGWRLGPRAQAIAESRPFRSRLLAVGRPQVMAAAKRLGCPVGLSVLHNGRRLILVRAQPDGTEDKRLVDDGQLDLVDSIAGRLLLAMQPAPDRRRLCRDLRLPDLARWPGCVDRRELRADLERIAKDGMLTTICGRTAAAAVAVAVALPDGEGGFAAVHTFSRPPLPPTAMAEMQQMAGRIAACLR
jgi:IclR family pca regulon transcriptional regulator